MLQIIIEWIRKFICFLIFKSHLGKPIRRRVIHVPRMIHGGWQGEHIEEEHDCNVTTYKCIICGATWEEYVKIEKESE